MLQPSNHRHFPRSPLDRRRDSALRAEITHLSTELLKLERNQEVQITRMAQIQQEVDEIKRLLKRLVSDIR
jgi:hypothetical protein